MSRGASLPSWRELDAALRDLHVGDLPSLRDWGHLRRVLEGARRGTRGGSLRRLPQHGGAQVPDQTVVLPGREVHQLLLHDVYGAVGVDRHLDVEPVA